MCKLQSACLSEITTLECPRAYLMESTESQGKPKKKKTKEKKLHLISRMSTDG